MQEVMKAVEEIDKKVEQEREKLRQERQEIKEQKHVCRELQEILGGGESSEKRLQRDLEGTNQRLEERCAAY